MVSDKRIVIDGFPWPPDALLERLRSPELPAEEFWRCIAYALYVMKDDEDYVAEINEVKKERTKSGFPQQSATTPQNEMPEPPQRLYIPPTPAPKIFHDNLDDTTIATALRKTDKMGLGPKQFAKAAQEFFMSIGWLVSTVDTQFVGWMKAHQIIDTASNDLQHVSRNETMDTLKETLKNTFQYRNGIGEWEDMREYYRRNDSSKINSGRKRS